MLKSDAIRAKNPKQPQVKQIFPPTDDSRSDGDEVLFVGGEPERKETMTALKALAEQSNYVVRPPFRVVVDGQVYRGGDTLTLLDNEHTRFWLRARWIEPKENAK